MKKSSLAPFAILLLIFLVIVLFWKNYYGFSFEKTVVQEPIVFIDCNRSLKEAVEAGAYDHIRDDFIDHKFTSQKEECGKEYVFKLYHFNQVMEADQVENEMRREDYRPATIISLLAFGELNPDLQREFPIFALGSKTLSEGFIRSPYLGFFAMTKDRTIGLGAVLRFHPRVRFLGVKEATLDVAKIN